MSPFSTYINSITPNILTSSTPVSFSVSVSFGGLGPISLDGGALSHNQQPTDDASETYVPQVMVFGAFLAILFVHVGINLLRILRQGRRGRQAMELQFPQPLPQVDQEGNQEPGANTDTNAAGNTRDDGEGIRASDVVDGIG